MKPQFIKTVIIVISLLMMSELSWAQTAPIGKEGLGSSPRVVGAYNKDLTEAVRAALPSYDDKSLGALFEGVAKKYANGLDPLKVNREAAEKFFRIKVPEQGDGQVQETDYSYQISKAKGRLYLHRNRDAMKPYAKAKGLTELKLAKRSHPAFLNMFGIDKSQLFVLNSNLILLEGVRKLTNGQFARPTPAVVDNVYTYAQRSVDGVLLEGSYVKIFSKNSKTFESLIIQWPRFQVHSELARFEVKSKDELLKEALEHLQKVANPKHEANVKMAVVLRPVVVGEVRMFIPAMKIGMYTRPMGDTAADEKAENGELFFIDLMKQPLQYTEPQGKDESEGDV